MSVFGSYKLSWTHMYTCHILVSAKGEICGGGVFPCFWCRYWWYIDGVLVVHSMCYIGACYSRYMWRGVSPSFWCRYWWYICGILVVHMIWYIGGIFDVVYWCLLKERYVEGWCLPVSDVDIFFSAKYRTSWIYSSPNSNPHSIHKYTNIDQDIHTNIYITPFDRYVLILHKEVFFKQM